VRREIKAGYVEAHKSRDVLDSKYGKLVPSRIGVIVKVVKERVKARLIHDLRRSGVNAKITMKERIVLPRLEDVRLGLLALLQALVPGEEITLLTLDFRDAFKQLKVDPRERRFLAGFADGRWFIYKTILFGVGTGPLVWGRVAALTMRSTQAMFEDSRARVQCYVDDPLVAIRGDLSTRMQAMYVIIAWWAALGLAIAWPKGTRGIGGTMDRRDDRGGLGVQACPASHPAQEDHAGQCYRRHPPHEQARHGEEGGAPHAGCKGRLDGRRRSTSAPGRAATMGRAQV
jgi:hypothetical protein